jgi:hypothetical protein
MNPEGRDKKRVRTVLNCMLHRHFLWEGEGLEKSTKYIKTCRVRQRFERSASETKAKRVTTWENNSRTSYRLNNSDTCTTQLTCSPRVKYLQTYNEATARWRAYLKDYNYTPIYVISSLLSNRYIHHGARKSSLLDLSESAETSPRHRIISLIYVYILSSDLRFFPQFFRLPD